MRPEQAEQLFVEDLFQTSCRKNNFLDEYNGQLDKLTGDASTRRYYRLYTKTKKSYIVCLADPVVSDQKTDVPFLMVHEVMNKNRISVPEIYDYDIKKGYFLEEDLGDDTLLSRLAMIQDSLQEYEIYRQLLDELIRIHKIGPDKNNERCCFKLSFDKEKLFDEIQFTKRFFITNYLGVELSTQQERIFDSCFLNICLELSSTPKVLTHRDFHSRNIMIKDSVNRIIDFQDARMGIPQYDLVSLLEDCYYLIQPENVDKLKKYYWENFGRSFFNNDEYGDFLRLYDLMTIQRVFKAVGSFAYIYKQRKDLRYIKYIGYGMEKVRTVLLRFKEYSELYQLLAKTYYEH